MLAECPSGIRLGPVAGLSWCYSAPFSQSTARVFQDGTLFAGSERREADSVEHA